MMKPSQSTVADRYQKKIFTCNQQLRSLKKRSSLLGWVRLVVIIVAMGSIVWQWPLHSWWQIMPAVGCIGIFLRLVVLSVNCTSAIRHVEQLIAINEEELAIANGNFTRRFDGGDFLPQHHAYAQDLDLLGRASLYQFINRGESYAGKRTLGQWLLASSDFEEIMLRQEAAKEMAPQLDWRQQLQASGRLSPVGQQTEQRLDDWLNQEDENFNHPAWTIVRWVGPIISVSLFMAYLADFIPTAGFNLYLVVFIVLTGYISKRATPAYNALGKLADAVNTLSQSLGCIEQMPAKQSVWLQQRRKALQNRDGSKASAIILSLNGILKRMDYRLNPLVFLPLNVLLFWDLQQMLALRKWNAQHANSVRSWLQVLGETEALASLATLAFNEPTWVFPMWDSGHGSFNATDLGHPLISADKRIVSDFSSDGEAQLSIITGSNMAGKSTFLRSVGLALVMGQAGAPVCATQARFSNMQVMSSMRIADNLEESASTFYAELKKLKSIIEAVNQHQPVFLLLDEILRGTNSGDRHTGSAALIQQLIRQKAVGLIATHDLALADLGQQHPGHIRNYHFDVQVEGEELYFDYKLKSGVCQSLNASILMKKIGIEMEQPS